MSWKCPHCDRVLKNANQWHCCVKKEFDELFENKDPMLLFIFEKILAEVYEWEGIHISATKNCIVFVANQTFLVIKPMKSLLNLKFYLDAENNSYPIYKIAKYGKQFEHHIRLNDVDQVNGSLLGFIRSSYMLFKIK